MRAKCTVVPIRVVVREPIVHYSRFCQGSLEPDLTFLLDAPVNVGLERISGRPADHFEREAEPFFERIRSHYLGLAKENKDRIVIIDANRSRKIIRKDLERYLRWFLKSYSATDA